MFVFPLCTPQQYGTAVELISEEVNPSTYGRKGNVIETRLYLWLELVIILVWTSVSPKKPERGNMNKQPSDMVLASAGFGAAVCQNSGARHDPGSPDALSCRRTCAVEERMRSDLHLHARCMDLRCCRKRKSTGVKQIMSCESLFWEGWCHPVVTGTIRTLCL